MGVLEETKMICTWEATMTVHVFTHGFMFILTERGAMMGAGVVRWYIYILVSYGVISDSV